MFRNRQLSLIVLFLTAASGCAALGPLSPLRPVERALVFAPSHDEQTVDTDDGGEAVWFMTSDDVKLHGRFFDHPQPRAVVLFCHGNAGSVVTWSQVGKELHQRHQLAVLVFDYRGYGKSEGQPTEEGLFQDGQAARRWLAKQAQIDQSDIVLMGRSLGGAVAVELAANGGARGLVLESTFSSLPDVAAVHLPWMTPHLNMTQRMNSASRIKHYHGPLLQSHGDADRLIPITLARKLHAAAPGEKKFIELPGADHNDSRDQSYSQALDAFLDALPPLTPAASVTDYRRTGGLI